MFLFLVLGFDFGRVKMCWLDGLMGCYIWVLLKRWIVLERCVWFSLRMICSFWFYGKILVLLFFLGRNFFVVFVVLRLWFLGIGWLVVRSVVMFIIRIVMFLGF